jgi:hypothetical protein
MSSYLCSLRRLGKHTYYRTGVLLTSSSANIESPGKSYLLILLSSIILYVCLISVGLGSREKPV